MHHHFNRRLSCYFASCPVLEEMLLVASELRESFTITSELLTYFPDMVDGMSLLNSEVMSRLGSGDCDCGVVGVVIESRDILGTWGRLRGLTSVTSSLLSSKYTTSCIVSWWYSTTSLRKRFSRAKTEFSCARRAFSARRDSSCSRICNEN